MEEPRKAIQLARIVVVFPNIGTEELVANAAQVLPGVTINVVTSGRYLNNPPSDEWLDERDAISGETPERISPEEAEAALSEMITDMRQHISKPGLVILDDNYFPKINIIGAMEYIDLVFKMVSPARADINLNHMPTYKGREMQLKWLGKLEDAKDYWDASGIPDRKKFEIPAGQHLSDVIRQIMAEPVSESRYAVDADEYENEDDDGDGDKYSDRSDQGYRTDNRIGSNTTFRALPFSFSNIIVNSPYSQNRNIARTRSFFSWLFFFINIFLAVALVYMIYNIALEYEEFAASDMPQKRAILEDPSEWLEESPFYIWTAWPKKLAKMALPYAGKRRQVSEELLDTVEKWVNTERFLRGSDPAWKFSDVLQRLRQAGFINSAPVKKNASEVVSALASTASGNNDNKTSVRTTDAPL